MATHPSSPAPGPAEFSLTPQGEFAGKSPVRVVKPIVLVGSDEHCHLHLISSTVSRHHALFVRDGDRLYVFDLGSRTKILVNGKEQREAELASGDVVRIGKFSFKFTSSRPVTGAGRRPGPVRLMVDGQAVPAPPENRLVLIGRTAGSDVMLVEESVSARHAVIFEVGGKRYVRDLDSRTGTFLNGKKIHQQEFKLGDELRIGETVLKLAELVESLAEHADVSPVDIDEPLLLEPEPIPVADEAELPPVAPVEEAIPLDLEPIESEPAEQPREPAVPIAEHSASEPLPLELEPEPASQPEAEPAAEPAAPAIDHFDDLLELLPEASKEAAEPAPLDLEPEPSSQPEPAAAQPAAVADHFDEVLESLPEIHPKELDEVVAPPPPEIEPVHEAAPFELEPEPPTQREAAPVVEAVPIAADYFDEVLESLPETHPKELDDVVAPPPEINEVHDAAPLEIEPELPTLREAAPVTEPVPVVADHFDEVLESLPETHPKETDEVVAPPAPKSSLSMKLRHWSSNRNRCRQLWWTRKSCRLRSIRAVNTLMRHTWIFSRRRQQPNLPNRLHPMIKRLSHPRSQSQSQQSKRLQRSIFPMRRSRCLRLRRLSLLPYIQLPSSISWQSWHLSRWRNSSRLNLRWSRNRWNQ